MIKELAIKNRSYRGYDPSRKVTKEELEYLVDLTRYTASSINAQPLKYHIAYEETEVADIQKLTKWAAALPELNLPYEGTCPPAFIVICHDTAINPAMNVFRPDIGISAQTMLLAATEMGLGGCMIGNFSKEEMKKLLNLDDSIEPVLVVAIGKPAEEVVIVEVDRNDSVKYYRDEIGKIHFVPKRKLSDILV